MIIKVVNMTKEIFVSDKKIAEKFNLKFFDGKAIEIKNIDDVKKACEQEGDAIFVKCSNWKIIPIENLIAMKRSKKLIAQVKDVEEARLAFQIMEKGVDGVLIDLSEKEEIEAIKSVLVHSHRLTLVDAEVVSIKRIGMGARTCIDTSDLMREGEGMLIGATSSGYVLIQAEVMLNPHVAPRPFRVNSGAISQYILVSSEPRTNYLGEVQSGDTALVVDRDGHTRKVSVVRNKIEWRPMVLVTLVEKGSKKEIKVVLQEAETIRVVCPQGSKGVTELKPGDIARVYSIPAMATHFGMKVEETIIEK